MMYHNCFPFSSVHFSCDSFSLVLNQKQALSTAIISLPPLPCQQQQSPRDGHDVNNCTRHAPLNAVAATTTAAAAATASTATLSCSPTSFKMTRNTRIIFDAGVDVGVERREGRTMVMSKMTTMTMGGGGGGGRGAKGETRSGGWGDDDDHTKEEDVDEDNGGSGVGVGGGGGGGRGGGARKNGMTLDQLSFFPSGDPSIANSRLSRPGDERKTTSMGEEEEEKEDRTGGGVGSVSSAGRHAPRRQRHQM